VANCSSGIHCKCLENVKAQIRPASICQQIKAEAHAIWQREPNKIASTSLDNISSSDHEHSDIASSRDGVGWGPTNKPGAEHENSPLVEMHSRSFFSIEEISELHELTFCKILKLIFYKTKQKSQMQLTFLPLSPLDLWLHLRSCRSSILEYIFDLRHTLIFNYIFDLRRPSILDYIFNLRCPSILDYIFDLILRRSTNVFNAYYLHRPTNVVNAY